METWKLVVLENAPQRQPHTVLFRQIITETPARHASKIPNELITGIGRHSLDFLVAPHVHDQNASKLMFHKRLDEFLVVANLRLLS